MHSRNLIPHFPSPQKKEEREGVKGKSVMNLKRRGGGEKVEEKLENAFWKK